MSSNRDQSTRGSKNIKANIQQQRTEVVEKFINIEKLINSCISQYFFKKVDANFFFFVLFDASFSYGLRVRVFEKIIKNLPKDTYKGSIKKLIEDLHRVGRIRNYFIHVGGFEFFPSKEGRTDVVLTKSMISEEGITPNPDNPSESLDFTSLHSEFLNTEKLITTELDVIYGVLGGNYVA